MAWQMIDDLTGAVVAEQDAQVLELTLRPRDAHVSDVLAAWDVASTEGPTLLAQLGEHLSGTAAPLGQVDVAAAQQKLDEVRRKIDALRAVGVTACDSDDEIDADDRSPSDVPLGRRIHEGLRTLDLPYRVEVAMRRLGYRLARAYDGAAAADDTCPEDPDGLHFATCGCDDVDPLNPTGPLHELDESADDAPDVSHGAATSQVSEPEPVEESGESAGNRLPDDVATPAAAARDRVGEAEKGRPTSAQLRAWALSHGLPVSTTGGIKKWVGLAYERVAGGPPDDKAWRDGAADGGSWTRPDGTVVVRQGAPRAPETSPSARPGDEEPPASDPFPPADRASADPSPAADEPSASDAAEGDPLPGPAETGRAAGPATAETPEPAGRDSGAPPAPAPAGEGGAGTGGVIALGDGGRSRPEQIDLAEELAAGGATPKAIVEQTGVTLDEARAAVRRQR